MKLTNRAALLLLTLFFLLVAIPTIKYPDFDHGDEWADADLLNTADNFLRFGFIKSRFLPVPEFHDQFKNAYTHYPPLPNIFHALLSKIFKTGSLYFHRGVALLFSYLHIICWFLLVRNLTGSFRLGLLASIFYLCNPYFIYGVDSMQESGADAVRSAILFVSTLLVYASRKKRIFLLGLLWVLFFIQSWLSFEYIIYIALFFILFKVFFKEAKQALSLKAIVFLLSAPVFGFLLHFLQNAWYFGSLRLAFLDFKSIAVERISQSKDSSIPLNLSTWWQYALSRHFQLAFMFKYYVVFPFLILSYFLYQGLSTPAKEMLKRVGRLGLLLGFCGASWYVVFPSHTIAHTYVMFLVRHIVPVASITFTAILAVGVYFIRENNPGNLFGRGALAVIVAVVLITGITQSNLPVTPKRIAGAKDFLKFRDCLISIRQVSSHKDEIRVNYYRNPFIRYYTHRRVEPIFDKGSLEKLNSLPRFFIYFPYGDQRSIELLEFLQRDYSPLYQCNSQRFPAIVCELKPKKK